MIRTLTALTVLMALAAPAAAQTLPANARFTYEWAQNGTALAGNSVSVASGSALSLQVYLRQTAGTEVLVAEGGLFEGSVRTTYGGTPGVIRVASVNDIVFNPQFNDTVTSNPTRVVNDNFAQFTAASDLTVAATPDAAGRVLLGTFTYQAVGAAGTSTPLVAEIIPNAPTFADTVTYTNFFNLDPVIAPVTLTVLITPVPEPAGLLAAGVLAAGATARVRRRRQAAR